MDFTKNIDIDMAFLENININSDDDGTYIMMVLKVYTLADLEQFSTSALNQRAVGSSSEHAASSR